MTEYRIAWFIRLALEHREILARTLEFHRAHRHHYVPTIASEVAAL